MNKWMFTALLTTALFASNTFANQKAHSNDAEKLCTGDSCAVQIQKLKRHSRYGNPEALILLATAYLNGDGVEKNPALALKKLKRATRSDSGKAMFMLAALYKDGVGTDVDQERSDMWLNRAVAQNYGPAFYQKALITLDFKKTDNSKEIELLLEAEKKHSKAAVYLLSMLRETGNLVEKDIVKAAEGYRDLAFYSYRDSADRLTNIANSMKDSTKEYERISELAGDIERITVTGQKMTFEVALDNTIERITRESMYDGRSTGSHIPGRGCTKKNNCVITSGSNELSLMKGGLNNK